MLWTQGTVCVTTLMQDNSGCTEGLTEAPGSGGVLRRDMDDIAKESRVWNMEDLVGHNNNFLASS